MDNELLLAYNIKENKKPTLKKVCAEYEIRLKEISKEEANQKTGYLAEIKGFEENFENKEIGPDAEFILFVNTDRTKLFEILKALKDENLFFSNKAALTEQNKNWAFSYLVSHIEKENLIMTEFLKFKPVLEKAIEIQKDLKNEELGKIIEKSKILMSSGQDMTDTKIKEMNEKLQNVLQKIIRQ